MQSRTRPIQFASLVCCMVFLFARPGNAGATQRPISGSNVPTQERQRGPDVSTYTVSIPAAAFHPQYDNYDYENRGGDLKHNSDPSHSGGVYSAAVYLPNSATVTRVTFYYLDNFTGNNGYFYLTRAGHTSNYVYNMASLTSDDASSSISTTTIYYPLIDNANYMYYLGYAVPYSSSPDTSNIHLYGVKIEYTMPLFVLATDYRSIPAAGFVPYSGSYWYSNLGSLLNFIDESGEGVADFQGPLFLPDRATIYDATFYYFDNQASKDGEAHLNLTDLAGSWPAMADFHTSGSSGYNSDNQSFSYTINNAANAYWTFFRLPSSSSNVMGKSLVVSYSYPTTFSALDHVSVPAGAFLPQQDGQNYENHGRFLKHFGGVDNIYVAPVYLPQGERIIRMTFYYDQIGAGHGFAYLQASAFNNMTTTLAWTESGGSGFTSSTQTLPGSSNMYVNNRTTVYWLKFVLPANDVWPCGVVVETSDRLVYLPVVQK